MHFSAIGQSTQAGSQSVTLHEYLNPSCEVVEPGVLVDHSEYVSVVIPGLHEQVYSPELGKEDYLVLSPNVPKKLAKLIRKSGFRVKSSRNETALPQPVTQGTQCPDTQESIQSIAQQRANRRRLIQSTVYSFGSGGVRLPKLVSSSETGYEMGTSSPRLLLEKYKGKKQKYSGIAILMVLVGLDGKVSQVKVVRSATKELDQKAEETVESYKFDPARKYGLPVPFQMYIQTAFQIY